MLDLKRPEDLIEIFENHFWEQSRGKLFLTFLASSEDLGSRLPLSPNDPAGYENRLKMIRKEMNLPAIDLFVLEWCCT